MPGGREKIGCQMPGGREFFLCKCPGVSRGGMVRVGIERDIMTNENTITNCAMFSVDFRHILTKSSDESWNFSCLLQS